MPLILNGDTGISGVDGTAGTPSLQGTDSNTGVFYATDIVGIATGGSERMRIDSSGNVGVGVSSIASSNKVQVSLASNTPTTGSPATGSIFNIQGGTTTVGDGPSLQLSNFSGAKETAWRISPVTTSGNNGDLVINGYTGGATYPERARFTNAGSFIVQASVSVGGVTPSASGAGITFPATQSASSDANTLDDYEEGTWTPAFTNLTINSGTPTYSGTYTKIGRLVYVTWSMSGTKNVTITADSTRINNLPFDSGANGWGPWGTTGSLTIFYGSISSGVNLYFTNTLSSTTESLSGSIVYIV